MKYLKHRRAYRMVQAIEDLQLRASIIRFVSPEFNEFYELLAYHKMDKLLRRLDSFKKKSN